MKNYSLTTIASLLIAYLAGTAILNLSFFHAVSFLVVCASFFLLLIPYNFLMVFVTILVLFPNVGYGIREGVKVFNIYDKGGNIIPFNYIFIVLLGLFFGTLAEVIAKKIKTHSKFILLDLAVALFLITSIGYVTVAFIFNPGGISMEGFKEAISQFGVLGFIEFSLFYFTVRLIVSNKERLMKLNNLILVLAIGRAIFGILRFIFFRGDPANIYANYEHSQVRLTFFDIYDSAFFIYAFVYCFIRVFVNVKRNKFLLFSIFILAFNVILSYRRTAWVGFILVFLYLSSKLSIKKRILSYIFSGLILLATTPILLLRFGTTQKILRDISFDFTNSAGMGRFGELFYALKSIATSPWFGLGASGTYLAPDVVHNWADASKFVHSGIIHIVLKMGILGLILFLLIILGLVLLYINIKKNMSKDYEYGIIFNSICATFVFLIPDIMFGTPWIQFRHAASLGLFVGLAKVVFDLSCLNNIIIGRTDK
jgi:hypothetical protein